VQRGRRELAEAGVGIGPPQVAVLLVVRAKGAAVRPRVGIGQAVLVLEVLLQFSCSSWPLIPRIGFRRVSSTLLDRGQVVHRVMSGSQVVPAGPLVGQGRIVDDQLVWDGANSISGTHN
jgi:hypothetical protein